jgi:hypothetical protein
VATISKFKCDKCGKEFSLQSGLLTNDLIGVKEGEDLPGGAKLPDKDTFTKIAQQKTTDNSFKFNNELIAHQKDCDGKIVFETVVFAD